MVPKTEYEMEPNGGSVNRTMAGVTERAEVLVGSIGQSIDSAAQTIQETCGEPRRVPTPPWERWQTASTP